MCVCACVCAHTHIVPILDCVVQTRSGQGFPHVSIADQQEYSFLPIFLPYLFAQEDTKWWLVQSHSDSRTLLSSSDGQFKVQGVYMYMCIYADAYTYTYKHAVPRQTNRQTDRHISLHLHNSSKLLSCISM